MSSLGRSRGVAVELGAAPDRTPPLRRRQGCIMSGGASAGERQVRPRETQ